MRRIIGMIGLFLPLALVVVVGAVRLVDVQTAAATATANVDRLYLGVPSMTCGSCEQRIRAALEAETGVFGVDVNVAGKSVRVDYDADAADPRALANAVTRSGYPARYLPPGAPPIAPEATGSRSGCGCC